MLSRQSPCCSWPAEALQRSSGALRWLSRPGGSRLWRPLSCCASLRSASRRHAPARTAGPGLHAAAVQSGPVFLIRNDCMAIWRIPPPFRTNLPHKACSVLHNRPCWHWQCLCFVCVGTTIENPIHIIDLFCQCARASQWCRPSLMSLQQTYFSSVVPKPNQMSMTAQCI